MLDQKFILLDALEDDIVEIVVRFEDAERAKRSQYM